MNGDRAWRWRGWDVERLLGRQATWEMQLGEAKRENRVEERKVSRGEKTERIEKREERGEI